MKCSIKNINGNRMIEIDGQHYVPTAFRSFRPTPANVSLFHRADVKLYQMLCTGLDSTLRVPYSLYGGIWVGDGEYDFTAFDKQMEMFVRYAPDEVYHGDDTTGYA